MKKIIASVIFLFIVSSSPAQNNYSVEFNYGLISPMTRTNGLQGIGKLNYQFGKNIKLYIALGYGVWGAETVHYKTASDHYRNLLFSDSHKLIPLYFGANYLLKESKFLSLYVNSEIGVSYLSFDQHNYNVFFNAETKEKEYRIPAANPISDASDYLIGVGIGLTGGHKVSKNTELLLAIKINTNYSTKTKGMFQTSDTYTSLTMGFNYFL